MSGMPYAQIGVTAIGAQRSEKLGGVS